MPERVGNSFRYKTKSRFQDEPGNGFSIIVFTLRTDSLRDSCYPNGWTAIMRSANYSSEAAATGSAVSSGAGALISRFGTLIAVMRTPVYF
ncbi:hypothetical protein Mal48_07770 [Thalassoglobus polymorphus]|uniref:Uncharacterized protein n=1 Tax=Thalassoglobus polymorphus TaxID=2527994 RepID=A0A517QIR3_9PLAN|nr:hypothetical protein Mal48_07770 [Thalassoglobus polymorphus]